MAEVQLDEAQRRRGTQHLTQVLREIEAECGFVVLDRIPLNQITTDEAILTYWRIGQMIGEPFVQNNRGTLLFDVLVTGADYTKGRRFSVTNERSSFHTDGGFNPKMPDDVALLCMSATQSGGENQMLSAYSLHNVLAEKYPHVLPALYQTFCFDRRGEFVEGESPTSEHSILSWDGSELTTLFLNYYILKGHRKAGRELLPEQCEALATVERFLKDGDLFVEFHLQPDQMLLSNNDWMLHNSSGYVDHKNPNQSRYYVRLWLSRQ